MDEIIAKYWQVIVAAGGAILAYARLDSKAKTNTRDLERLEKRLADQRAEDKAEQQAQMAAVHLKLGEVGSDIKELLQRTAK